MRKLILIKHAAPVVTPGVSPEKWVLSESGRLRCEPLAEAIRACAPAVVVASREPKAAETGAAVAARLGTPFESADGLHEHDRSNVPHLPSREFISLVEVFFRKPAERVLGNESADEALTRFETAVGQVLARHPDGNVALVSHGTVLALMLAKHGGGRAFELWRRMGLPSYAAVELPTCRVERVVERV